MKQNPYSVEKFVARENIARFKAQLLQTSDEAKKETLRRLLLAEKRLLSSLEQAPTPTES